MAARVSRHLWATGQWHALSIERTRLLGEINIVESSDHMTLRYGFPMKFKTSTPKREELRKTKFKPMAPNWKELLELIDSDSKSIGIFKSMRLPDHCSVFQVEVSPNQAAVKIIVDNNVHKQSGHKSTGFQCNKLQDGVRLIADVSMRWRTDMKSLTHWYWDTGIFPEIAERMIWGYL